MQQRKSKIQHIEFSQDYLKDLLNDDNSCVTLKRKKQHLSLHPYNLTDLNRSLKDMLNKSVGKYLKELDGILLAYQNIKMLDCDAPIYDDSCFIHVNVEADFYVFQPEINRVLNGTVVKKMKNVYIGCLLYQIFNVSMTKPNDAENWIGNDIKIGHEISFKITQLNLSNNIPHIKAQPIAIIGGKPVNINAPSDVKIENHILKFEDDEGYHGSQDDTINYYEFQGSTTNNKTDVTEEVSENFSLMEIQNIKSEAIVEDHVIKKKKGKRKHSGIEFDNDKNEIEMNIEATDDVLDESRKKSKKHKRKSNDIVDDGEQCSLNNVQEDHKHILLHEQSKCDIDNKNQKQKRKLSDTFNSIKETQLNLEMEQESFITPKKKRRKSISKSVNDIENILLQEALNIAGRKSKNKKNDSTDNNLKENFHPNIKIENMKVEEEMDDFQNYLRQSSTKDFTNSKEQIKDSHMDITEHKSRIVKGEAEYFDSYEIEVDTCTDDNKNKNSDTKKKKSKKKSPDLKNDILQSVIDGLTDNSEQTKNSNVKKKNSKVVTDGFADLLQSATNGLKEEGNENNTVNIKGIKKEKHKTKAKIDDSKDDLVHEENIHIATKKKHKGKDKIDGITNDFLLTACIKEETETCNIQTNLTNQEDANEKSNVKKKKFKVKIKDEQINSEMYDMEHENNNLNVKSKSVKLEKRVDDIKDDLLQSIMNDLTTIETSEIKVKKNKSKSKMKSEDVETELQQSVETKMTDINDLTEALLLESLNSNNKRRSRKNSTANDINVNVFSQSEEMSEVKKEKKKKKKESEDFEQTALVEAANITDHLNSEPVAKRSKKSKRKSTDDLDALTALLLQESLIKKEKD